jgi:hypothetical protein
MEKQLEERAAENKELKTKLEAANAEKQLNVDGLGKVMSRRIICIFRGWLACVWVQGFRV